MLKYCFCLFWRDSPQWAKASSLTRFLDHTQRRTTVSMTSLDEWLARRRDLYLTTRNTHNRQTSMPPGGIRTHNLRWRAAIDLRLRPRGHWDRANVKILVLQIYQVCWLHNCRKMHVYVQSKVLYNYVARVHKTTDYFKYDPKEFG